MSLRISATVQAAPSAAEGLLRAGRLAEALQALGAQVRGNPADPAARVLMFQLLAAAGQWDRAATQLAASQEIDGSNAVLGMVYGSLLAAERSRAAVFGGEGMPTMIGEPEPWQALLLQALKHDIEGMHAQAAGLRSAAFEQAPAHSGRIDGSAFAWLADADPRFGPCLELVVEGRYGWAPFARIRSLRMEPPGALCDTLWAPATVTWDNGGQAAAFVPVRYPGTEAAGDDALRLARRTDWSQLDDDTWIGTGQRMLATDAGEYPLLEVRQIDFDGA